MTESTGMYWNPPVYHEIHRYATKSTGIRRNSPECAGVCLKAPGIFRLRSRKWKLAESVCWRAQDPLPRRPSVYVGPQPLT